MNYYKKKKKVKKRGCPCTNQDCQITFSFVEQYQNVEGAIYASDLFYAPYAWDGSAFSILDTDVVFIEYSIDGEAFTRIETLAALGNYYNLTNYDTGVFPIPTVPVIHTVIIKVNKGASFVKFDGILSGLPLHTCNGIDLYFNGGINGVN